ncbi:lipocalin family protein [Mesonia sp.]|uniref:lipocalin family protein n=1 Tax=Mesonia sp. TaxID=1960830 RepID=UPI003F954FCF
MKKTILLLLVAIVAVSCGTTKIERQAERTFKGDWTLTKISYPNSTGFVDVTLFQDAPSKCFTNSSWNFVSNNNKGNYMLNGAGCDDATRGFVWSVQEIDESTGLYTFSLKVVEEGENARKVDTGYRLKLVSLSENNMTWEQTVSYEGKPFLIIMDFVKSY